MRDHRYGLIIGTIVLAVLVLGGSHANAAEQGITGKKLLLKSKPKMVLLSKDALVTPGANGSGSDPRCVPDGGSGLGGSVRLDDGSNSVTLDMPCGNWTTNGKGTLYKYKDKTGIPKVGKVKSGLLKVVSPAGMGGFPVPNGAATVDVQVNVGSDKYCMTFSGTGDGNKFLVKDATTGVCPTPIPTSTPTPTETPTPTDTPTETPTDTPTDTPTQTPEPTDTPTPTVTDSPTPTETPLPCFRSCKEILIGGQSGGNGIYFVDPDCAGPILPVQVQCDMVRDGGGWTFGLKTWYQAGIAGNTGPVGAVPDALTLKGNAYKLSDEVIGAIIGPGENFDMLVDQAGYNSFYSTGNYEYVIVRNYTAAWRFDAPVAASSTTTVFQSYRLSDDALAWTGNLACGVGGYGINCLSVISNNPMGGAGCDISMGTATSSGWHHLYLGESNTDSYLYICNGAQHSSSVSMNHRAWFRER